MKSRNRSISILAILRPKRARCLRIDLVFPWWINPIFGLLMLGATTAIYALALPASEYEAWGAPKYFSGQHFVMVLLGVGSFALGYFGAFVTASRGRLPWNATISFTATTLRRWIAIYRILCALTICAYIFWIAHAVSQGVSISDLTKVLDREGAAISELKANSRPVAGVTSFTQLGPIAVGLGFILSQTGAVGRGYFALIALAGVRTIFYAERLALIEVLIPLAILICAKLNAAGRHRKLIVLGPFIGAIGAWSVFAVSEYFRSWVYYQNIVQGDFFSWVTQRLLGYYATGYNNSALFDVYVASEQGTPYFSISALWNAPIVSQLFPYPSVGGVAPEDAWIGALKSYGNVEFNNVGSFVMTGAELGVAGLIFYWLILGFLVSWCYMLARRARLNYLLLYVSSYVGLLEVPRFVYWTQGRFIPVILGFCIIVVGMNGSSSRDRLLAQGRESMPELMKVRPPRGLR